MDDTIIIEHRGPSSLSGTKAQFTGTVVTFGRRTGNDVVFDPTRDRLVSGRHAELSCRDGRLYLRDLGSSNGTFVNRRRIDGVGLVRLDIGLHEARRNDPGIMAHRGKPPSQP